MASVTRDQVRQMLDDRSATLVEVLDPPFYSKFHLPGAINVPLSDDFEHKIQEAVPDKHRPVIVYCMDEHCEASPEAAQKMEELGYDRVYDYEAGKMDWKNAGMPIEE